MAEKKVSELAIAIPLATDEFYLVKDPGGVPVSKRSRISDLLAVGHAHAAADISSGTLADARIAASNVTQHQAALSITESQISDFGTYQAAGSYAAASHGHAASDITSGVFADARIAVTNVTQHQAALTITEAQISDLGAYAESADLASAVTGQGAALIGIEDSGANFAATNVEGALAELATAGGGLSQEQVEDFVGGMVSGNAETRVSVTYNDATGKLDFSVDADLANYDNTTTGYISGYAVTQGDVTQHQAALSITESQISDFGSYATKMLSISAPTGTSYTLVQADGGQVVTMDNAGANVVTIPSNGSVPFGVGTSISIIRKGAGATSIAAGAGVTLNGVVAGSGQINNQWQGASLLKIGVDEWIVSGDIGAVS